MAVLTDYGESALNLKYSLNKPFPLPSQHVLEGNSGSGKTTVSHLFDATEEVARVGEYGHFFSDDIGYSFPDFPPTDNESVIASNPLWIALDLKRRDLLIEQYNRGIKNVVVERSPLSLLAFEYAKDPSKYPFVDSPFQEIEAKYPSDMANLLLIYKGLFNDEILEEPQSYVYLDVKPKTSKSRILSRSGNPTLNFLYDEKTITYISTFMKWFLYTFIPPEQFIIIDTELLNAREVFEQTAKFIQQINKGGYARTEGISKMLDTLKFYKVRK